jgi:hypothetical protein
MLLFRYLMCAPALLYTLRGRVVAPTLQAGQIWPNSNAHPKQGTAESGVPVTDGADARRTVA